ncbi:hypothetical protein KKA27_00230 [Patescibacteria group bacterium]|nr:hypothetical protein [Patescibacteria group bacterium]
MVLSKSQKEKISLKEEIRGKLLSYMTAAFGLVAGLAWNDAIKSLIEFIFPLERNTVLIKFFYAVLITFAVVLISVYLLRFFKKEDK